MNSEETARRPCALWRPHRWRGAAVARTVETRNADNSSGVMIGGSVDQHVVDVAAGQDTEDAFLQVHASGADGVSFTHSSPWTPTSK